MSVNDILTALRSKDYHAANQAFAQTMQTKLADRLAVERQRVFKEGSDPDSICANPGCKHEAGRHDADDDACYDCDCLQWKSPEAQRRYDKKKAERLKEDWDGPCPKCGDKLWKTSGSGAPARHWCRTCGVYSDIAGQD